MRQYNQIKSKHPDALLLFRVGDFYETFGDDAVKTSKILDIVLTKRANGSASEIALAGFPHHSIDTYLPKLVRAGQRVAICDQLEDPKMTKKIVKRGVTELVTPGVTIHDQVLQAKSNNFLASVYLAKSNIGISFCDISTGEFLVAEGNRDYIDKLIQSFSPSEILIQKSKASNFFEQFGNLNCTFPLEDWIYKDDFAKESLTNHFGTNSLKGFGIENMSAGILASGAVFHYLKETQHNKLHHIQFISRIARDEFVWMDRFTIQNLELFHSNSPEGTSLLDVIDFTQTSMGGRMLKKWLAMPLKDEKVIGSRLDITEAFIKAPEVMEEVVNQLSRISDLERLTSKLSTLRIQPKELLSLKESLINASELKKLCLAQKGVLAKQVSDIEDFGKLIQLLDDTLHEDPPALVSKGNVIKSGVSEELDELRSILNSGKDYLINIQKRETEKTGIQSLKIAYNNVFGYYLEVRNAHKDKVPEEWIRKQTLVNAERYITEELKEYEGKILGAEEKIGQLELQLYNELLEEVLKYLAHIQKSAITLARIDCLSGFAALAKKRNYEKPVINEGTDLVITEGRHPVIETRLPAGEEYISNDVLLNREDQQLLMITGPNMSGKSALLRQTALICILAQIGSFVPASAAELGVLDRIFVRVGASDNISQGESTFMVEMNETSSILNNLSERSLILLDEIGRGTSTYDGISIAWAIAEFIHEHPSRAKTLFATHYHELNEMENGFSRIRNFNVSVKEVDQSVIFMRKLKRGGSEHSFGIHVAQMAGMPKLVINRANHVLKELEKSRHRENSNQSGEDAEMQLSFFNLDDPILEDIREDIKTLDINTLTPIEALMKLSEIKRKIGAE